MKTDLDQDIRQILPPFYHPPFPKGYRYILDMIVIDLTINTQL